MALQESFDTTVDGGSISEDLLVVRNPPIHVSGEVGPKLGLNSDVAGAMASRSTAMEAELRALAVMERSLYRRIPIRVSQLMQMRLKQFDLRVAEERLQTIKASISACEYVPLCDSIMHRKPAGCPKCGVVHLGGHANAVQYVRSQDKTSGVIRHRYYYFS